MLWTVLAVIAALCIGWILGFVTFTLLSVASDRNPAMQPRTDTALDL